MIEKKCRNSVAVKIKITWEVKHGNNMYPVISHLPELPGDKKKKIIIKEKENK